MNFNHTPPSNSSCCIWLRKYSGNLSHHTVSLMHLRSDLVNVKLLWGADLALWTACSVAPCQHGYNYLTATHLTLMLLFTLLDERAVALKDTHDTTDSLHGNKSKGDAGHAHSTPHCLHQHWSTARWVTGGGGDHQLGWGGERVRMNECVREWRHDG